MKNFIFFALAATGKGISGSDRIFIEFARRWSKSFPITIYLWEEGYQMCLRQSLNSSSIKYQVSSMRPWYKLGFLVNYLARIIEGIKIGLTLKIDNSPDNIIYSASEFWMDTIPGLILKMRFPKIKWVAAWYQTAPKPWQGFAEGERKQRYFFKSFLYWLIQLPMKFLVTEYADFVLVNNEEEKKVFPSLDGKGKVVIVLGAVDLQNINIWKRKFKKIPKIFDAVFQGRFHPQKGVLELIDIWKLVVNQKNDAKLIMIGDGPLMESVKFKVQSEKLENNIKLMGYLFDGEEKYRIFSQSKVVVHPAFYDSGGMAAAEAMAFGLPAVGFDLSSFKSYYPQGMIKVPIGDLDKFSDAITQLLNDRKKREKIGMVAKEMIERHWSWDERSKEILEAIIAP